MGAPNNLRSCVVLGRVLFLFPSRRRTGRGCIIRGMGHGMGSGCGGDPHPGPGRRYCFGRGIVIAMPPPPAGEARARGRRPERVNRYTEIHGDGHAALITLLIPLSTVGEQTRPMTAAEKESR